ncbi:TetR/AcrR family transcriptional regulator [Amycolatopsis sp. FBCC-B4732]|uniref:TetR/AcrR family transcriptional regulator n=1 Tax=Amycolatopsis sp. FBCC-B4732 TaxID=3079339 RepID=UPI001FF4B24A|nr:TetR/AcrR family transcriptional regulator [Amycolatopsis sp. FBCC-B4732]UOX91895.1 TetR/AcrR family transcriptional regulator [Amycolatopsis sp. FBCC-B4732]
MAVPYESTGRQRQKGRTRAALVEAAHALLADGGSPTVEDAAAAAGISRTTAYRYFPNQRALLLAAYPEIQDDAGLLPADAPADPVARLELVMREFIAFTLRWEPQLRAQLRLSLEPGARQPVLRRGRAIRWIEEALVPLADTHPHLDVHGLATAIRSASGIESLVWLTDIGGLDRARAAEVLAGSARAILRAALDPVT